jgi:hypothetical protein
VIKSHEEVRDLGEILPQQLNLNGTMMVQSKVSNQPTITYDPDTKSEVIEQSDIGLEKLVIEVSNRVAFAIPCTKEEELGMHLTTKQCFGFNSRGQRCKNRRQSSSRLAWCHHHVSQKTFFESNPISSIECFVPDWW